MDPYKNLAELQRDGRRMAKDIVIGLTAAPSLSRLSSKPCVIQLPVMLHNFEYILNFQAKRCSSTPISILRSCYGNVLDACLTFATSIWTPEEKAKYESCECAGHKRDAIMEYHHAIKARGKDMEPLQEIITWVFEWLASVFQHIKDRHNAGKKTIKETKWPSSPSQLVSCGPSQIVTALVTWARLLGGPTPIYALHGMADLIPSLASALHESETALSFTTRLLSQFSDSLQTLNFAKLAPYRLKTIERTISHFYQIFGNGWFQQMKDPALTTRRAQALVPLYNTIPNLITRLRVFPFRENSMIIITTAFSSLAINIYCGLAGSPSSVPLLPIFVEHTNTITRSKTWEFGALARGILFLRYGRQCAKLTCASGDRGVRATFKGCGACKVAMYCSRECQVSDWKAHKGVCRGIKNLLPPTQLAIPATTPESLEAREAFRVQIRNSGLAEEDIKSITEYVVRRFNNPIILDAVRFMSLER